MMRAVESAGGVSTTSGRKSRLTRWVLFGFTAIVFAAGCDLGPNDSQPDVNENPALAVATTDVIVFNRTKGSGYAIWKMNSNGTGQQQVTYPPNGAWSSGDESPSLSPAGDRIAFVRNEDIWLVGINGGQPTNWSSKFSDLAKTREAQPEWSPNGTQLAFVAHSGSGEKKFSTVYRAPVTGGSLSALTDDNHLNVDPAWSTAGTRIYFATNRGINGGTDYDIVSVDLAGGNSKTHVKGEYDDRMPALAPDTHLAYLSQRDEGKGLEDTVVVADSATHRVVTGEQVQTDNLSYSPDGTKLAYGRGNEIHVVDASAIDVDTTTQLTSSSGYSSEPNWRQPSKSFIKLSDVTAQEGSDPALVFDVKLSVAAPQDVTANVQINEGSAKANQDYTLPPGQITIPAGSAAGEIVVPILNDTVDEGIENLTAKLTNASPSDIAVISRGTALGKLRDNDPMPTLSVSDVNANEGSPAVFNVQLSNQSGRAISFDYALTAGTATSPEDFTVTNGTKTIEPNTNNITVSVPTVQDTLDEGDHGFTLTVSNVQNAAEGDLTATATIVDDDGGVTPPPPPGEEEIAFVRFTSSAASNIWTVPVEGGTATEFAFGPSSMGYDYEPDWGTGANSHKLYFSSYNDEDPDIYVRDTSTGDVSKVYETDDPSPSGPFGQANEYEPAVSPDGTKVAFSSTYNVNGGNPPVNGQGTSEIYVLTLDQPLSSTNPLQLTNNDVSDSQPTWHPGGNLIAYTHGDYSARDIYKVPADGSGTPTQLTTTAGAEMYPEWAPDGNTIVFTGDQEGNLDLYFLRMATGAVEQVTFDSADQYDATFSPDGQEVAYSRSGDIVRMDIATCAESFLTSDSTTTDQAPDWKNPGGITALAVPTSGCAPPPSLTQSIAWASGGFDGSRDVWAMNDDGTAQMRLISQDGYELQVAWSPDGEKVAFVGSDGDSEIYVFDPAAPTAAGTNPYKLTDNAVTNEWPAWSPDGQFLAYSQGSGTSEELFFENADGSSSATQVTANSARDRMPTFAPDDGDPSTPPVIAYVSDRDHAAGELYKQVLFAPESSATRLTNNTASDHSPAWSPVGSQLAFVRGSIETNEIYTMDPSAPSEGTALTNNAHSDTSPAWSPDGSKLVFASRIESDTELYVMSLADPAQANWTRLTDNAVDDDYPSWRLP